MVLVLVFGVGDMLHVSRPAASTAAAYIALLRRRAITAFINNRGPMGPGLTGRCVILRVA